MLKGIPEIITPDLMRCMLEMGHTDRLVIVDANFPAFSNATNNVVVLSGVNSDEILEAILKFFPLDDFVEDQVFLMNHLDSEPVPEVWADYSNIIKEKDFSNAFSDFAYLDRLDFYEETKDAYLVVKTSDTRRYANLILQKGVC